MFKTTAKTTKIWKIFFNFLIITSLTFGFSPQAEAQLLPKTDKSQEECFVLLSQSGLKKKITNSKTRSDTLGCTIKTGDIQLWMIPFFIIYLINFLLMMAGIISVLMLVIGGYLYIIGSAQGQSDKGKQTIMYSIIGLVVTLLAWIIVNVVQSSVT